ncbi:MAG TPA: DoxX family protein [Acidimicrobiales bacterium]
MHTAYIAVTVAGAIAYAGAAALNFTHNKAIVEVSERLDVPTSWMVPLGALLAAGSIGLLAGFAVPALGIAAAAGLTLYFVCAAGAHIRARDPLLASWVNWAVFFSLAVAVLVVAIAYHGRW